MSPSQAREHEEIILLIGYFMIRGSRVDEISHGIAFAWYAFLASSRLDAPFACPALSFAMPSLFFPFLSLPSLSFPYLTLPYLPYLTLPYLTLPYLTLPYLTLPYLTLLS